MAKREKSIWFMAFKFAAYALLFVSILSIFFYFSYLRYYSVSFIPQSDGGEEGLIVFLAPIIPFIYILDLLNINAESQISDTLIILAPIIICVSYYLIGLVIFWLRKLILNKK